jgi:trehalose 6-phosphate phosphatase
LTVRVPAVLEPLCAHPETAAVFLDFDGTLSPIVDDPSLARPLEGVPALLAQLGSRFGVVAVVSGRPAAFLGEHLGRPAGVRLIGLYGLEEVGQVAGPTVDPAAVARWVPVMAASAEAAEASAPAGVSVERKPAGFTLNFRHAPAEEGWVRRFAEDQRDGTGAVLQPGRMSIELRPAIDTDKGTVVAALVRGCTAACCFGDDLGDLPAFEVLGALAAEGLPVARVAVVDGESPAAGAAAADLVVAGPRGALELLGALVAAVGG